MRGKIVRTFLIFTLLIVAGPALAEEKLFGTNVDLRTILTFKVPDAAVQKMLPDGWEVNSPTTGPSGGSNLTLVLDEELASHDPDGKPVATFRGAALSIPSRKKGTDTSGPVVISGFFDAGIPGKFGVYTTAQVTIERKTRTDPDGKSTIEEIWQVRAADGNSVEAQIQFVRGLPAKSKTESKLFSAINPDIFAIYRVEQASDVVRSSVTGVDRVTKLSIKASGSKLSMLFDGTEQLISVISVPWYSRQVYFSQL
jgi:hypothetical protein